MERTPRSVEKIIEGQVRQWELQRKSQRAEKHTPDPVITVSRQYGACGAAVARQVAQRLGYECCDRKLLDDIAASTDTPRSLLATLDEHRKDVIRERIGVLGSPAHPTATDYEQRLLDVLHAIAKHGRAVVVGRGAEVALDAATTLRVRIICPLEQRVRGLVERNEIGEQQARADIATIDADRRDFMREHFGRHCEDATAYDLVINTEHLSVEAAADIVVAAHTARFSS